jgi:hypothetical protein
VPKLQIYKDRLGIAMTIISNFTLPAAANALAIPAESPAPFFITFTTSDLPETGQSWCPDVRAALPHLKTAFGAQGSPDMAFVEVGQRPEYVALGLLRTALLFSPLLAFY